MMVGAATLDRGQARVVVSFAMPAATEVPLRLRYAPDAPWYRPAGELVATQPLEGQSPWKKSPLALAGLGAIAWLVMARLPRRAPRPAGRSIPVPARRGGALVELVRADSISRGWSGQVVDADEHSPVPNARLSIERRGFEHVSVVALAASDPQGRFALEAIALLPGDELVAEAPFHAMLRATLPPTGELRVALVLRRRALLDRLVAWARHRGGQFDARPDATPGQVRRAAGPDIDLVRWASAVERAAYGGEVVDQRAHHEVDRLAPSDAVDPSAASQAPRPVPKRPRR